MFPMASLDPVAVFNSLFPQFDVSQLVFQNSIIQQQAGPSSIPFVPTANLASLASGTKHDGYQPTDLFQAQSVPPGCYAPAVIWPEEDFIGKTFDEMSVDTEPMLSDDEDELPFEMGRICTENYFPTHFMRGTVLSLKDGSEKTIEKLSTDDFIASASFTNDAEVEMCMVLKVALIEDFVEIKLIVLSINKESTINVPKAHPFFILGKGWGSCDPAESFRNFGYKPGHLKVGDIIIALAMSNEVLKEYQLETSITKANIRCEKKFQQFDSIKNFEYGIDGRRSAPPLGLERPPERIRTWSLDIN